MNTVYNIANEGWNEGARDMYDAVYELINDDELPQVTIRSPWDRDTFYTVTREFLSPYVFNYANVEDPDDYDTW